MFLDSAISPPVLTSCSSHTEACNALGATDGITSTDDYMYTDTDHMYTVTTC